MFQKTSWKVLSVLLVAYCLLLLFIDDIYGIPQEHRFPIELLEILKLLGVVTFIAFGFTIFISIFSIGKRPMRQEMVVVFPWTLSFFITLVLIVNAIARYYVATVKLGLHVW